MTGSDLVEARRRHGLTQHELSTILGVHPITVSKWERDTLTPRPRYSAILWMLNDMPDMPDLSLREELNVRGGLAALWRVLNAHYGPQS